MQESKKEFINSDKEISYLDDFFLIISNWKMIFILGISGFILSFFYLLISPNQYVAIAQINLARASLKGNIIEEPQAVVNRMSVSNSFDPLIISECGLGDNKSDPKLILKAIKISVRKEVGDAVELRVAGTNPELTRSCATKVFDLISKTQSEVAAKIASDMKATADAKILKINRRLEENKELLVKVNQSRDALSPLYFTILTEIRALEDQRETLLINLESEPIKTKLQAPIYVEHKTTRSVKLMVLAVGFFGGLFLGLIVALLRPNFVKLKSNAF